MHLPLTNEDRSYRADSVDKVYKKCNSPKGDEGIYECFRLDRRYEVPRIVEGKYLKLLYRQHDARVTLDADRDDLEDLCKKCDLGKLCPKKADLTVYCLESILERI